MADFQSVSVAQGSGPMAKAMSIAGMIVAGLLVLVFAADLAVGIPFGGVRTVDRRRLPGRAALILGYLSWNAFRDSK